MIPFVCSLMLSGGCLCLLGRRTASGRRSRTIEPLAMLHAVGAGLLAAAIALIATGLPVVAALAALAGSTFPALVRRRRSRRQQRERLAAWPVLLDDVTSAVRAGLGLPEALIRAGRQSPADHAFTKFETEYRRSGDFGSALDSLRIALADPVFDQLAQALIVTRDVGGTDLTSVLRSLSGFVRDGLHLRGELEARQSWTVNSARMAVAAPWVVLLLLSSRPATIHAYSQLQGALVLVAVAAASALAYAAMLRIARLPVVAA